MKYICLGYIEPNKFESMSESERNAMLDECFTYDDELRKSRNFAAGEALQPANTAMTLYWKNGKVKVSIGVGKGKVEYDKRQDLKKRDSDREMKRAQMQRTKGK